MPRRPHGIILALKCCYYREMFVGPFPVDKPEEAHAYARLFHPNLEYRTYIGDRP